MLCGANNNFYDASIKVTQSLNDELMAEIFNLASDDPISTVGQS